MRRMTPNQFAHEAVPYLLGVFLSMKPLLQTPAQLDLWYRQVGHVELEAFIHAVDAYAAEHDKRPTIAALGAYLPGGTSAEKCAHVWETFEHDGQVVYAGCGRCGFHQRPTCRCAGCVCSHAQAEPDGQRAGVWWYWCPDCRHVLRLPYPLAQQP